MVTIWGRNIRANLYPVGKGTFRPLPFTLPATASVLSLEGKVLESRTFPGIANIFTKNTLPSTPRRFHGPVIFFTKP